MDHGVPLLLASNRGPVSFVDGPDGGLELRRGGGGLVSALVPPDGVASGWVCAALNDADRRAVREGLVPPEVRMLPLDAEVFAAAYDRVANSVLWPAQHLLPADPVTDADLAGYRAYADAFAEALASSAAPHGSVLVQDYHLALVPARLRALRPDLRVSHFSHTPWAPPDAFARLPLAGELLEGMLGADAVGFLSPRWARAFLACCSRLLGAQTSDDAVRWQGRTVRVAIHPLGVDAGALRARAARPDVARRTAELQALVGDRQLVLRVDRSEPTKGIVQGLQAYAALLRRHPEHRGRVVHLALAYPSRSTLPQYRAYAVRVREEADAVRAEFGDDAVELVVEDDHARSLAALGMADVLLVNPVRDGMNLVAKEGAVLSRAGLALVLSREAGAADELGADALLVDPHDVVATADALHAGLVMGADERRERTGRLAAAAGALPPSAWLAAQQADLVSRA